MPGKKGFGDTRKKSSQSPAYKKQKKQKNNIGKDPIPQITNKNQNNDLFVLQVQHMECWQPKTE